MSVAFLFNFIQLRPENTIRIIQFFEHLKPYSSYPDARLSNTLIMTSVATLISKFPFKTEFKYLPTIRENYFFGLYFIVVGLLIALLIRKDFITFRKAGCIFFVAIALESIFRVRSYNEGYQVFVDILVIISFFVAGWQLVAEIKPSKTQYLTMYLLISLLVPALIFQNIWKINNNGFLPNRNHPDYVFCEMADFTPELGKIIHHEEINICLEIILDGCDPPDGRLSSCRGD